MGVDLLATRFPWEKEGLSRLAAHWPFEAGGRRLEART